jgi:hypothetical protein
VSWREDQRKFAPGRRGAVSEEPAGETIYSGAHVAGALSHCGASAPNHESHVLRCKAGWKKVASTLRNGARPWTPPVATQESRPKPRTFPQVEPAV